jgi:hypothetical protein
LWKTGALARTPAIQCVLGEAMLATSVVYFSGKFVCSVDSFDPGAGAAYGVRRRSSQQAMYSARTVQPAAMALARASPANSMEPFSVSLPASRAAANAMMSSRSMSVERRAGGHNSRGARRIKSTLKLKFVV